MQQPETRSSEKRAISVEAGDSDSEIGPLPTTSLDPPATEKKPKKLKRLKFEESYLRNIPSAQAYEKSLMHRDTVTHVLATITDFIITASCDGHVKFWKKLHKQGIEFVKHFRAHLAAITKMSVNFNGTLLCTIADDKAAKIFDVVNFDMINVLKLGYQPSTCCWIHRSSDPVQFLAICQKASNLVHVYDPKTDATPLKTLDNMHLNPISLIEYNAVFDVVISIDQSNMVEYWSGPKNDYEFPKNVQFKYKTDTDLYEFAKNKVTPTCLTISPDGKHFATFDSERKIRIFRFLTGKITKVLDEGLSNYSQDKEKLGLSSGPEFSRHIAIEKELQAPHSADSYRLINLIYDDTGNFLLYAFLRGIKVVNLVTNRVVRTIGEPDPLLVCTAYKKNRVYLFTNVEPYEAEGGDNDRDIFNEKPKREDMLSPVEQNLAVKRITDTAVIHTTLGDIFCLLFPKECPKTVENFCTHARNGYFNGHTFHRVIKSFMIQTGDPTGTGMGGESIWGHDFDDEFHPSLKHDRPYTISMANAGPNTNGSQFFITVCPTPHLDGKHTVFGRVSKGMEVVQNISKVKAYPKNNKPYEDINIISITLK